ncbi:MAG: hypothetical protein R2827_12035 [Bdellovibrionales bacterium]
MKSKRNVHVISRKNLDGLTSLVAKLLQKPNLTKQMEQRYFTNTQLQVECVEDGRVGLYDDNLSTTGAMVEFTEDPQLSAGSLLKMKVRLSEINAAPICMQKWFWTKRDPKSGRTGCGVRFINEQTMYEALMNRI